MKLVLAENEKFIKEWEYGHVKQRKADPITKSVILTDKRIVSETATPYKIDRVEVRNSDVYGVNTEYGEKRIPLLLALGIIGAIAAIVGIAIKEMAVIIVGVIAAALFGILWWFVKKCGFAVVIFKRNCEETAFGLGVLAQIEQKAIKRGTKKHKQPKIRIDVDREVAREIADTISNYLF